MNIKININKTPEDTGENSIKDMEKIPINKKEQTDKEDSSVSFPKVDISDIMDNRETQTDKNEGEIEEDFLNKINKASTPNNDKKKNKVKRKTKNKKDLKELEKESESLDKLIEAEYNKLKIKKAIIFASIIITMVSLLGFNIYMLFIKKEKTVNQLAIEINSLNRDTPFPTEGVYGYIKMNVEKLLGENISYLSGTSGFSIDSSNVFITRINKRSASIANVYFNATIDTNIDSVSHNFMLPVFYDWESSSYHPAGSVSLRVVDINNDTKVVENDQLSFKNHQKQSSENIESAKIFLTNFFTIVYNTKGDYSQQYSGKATLGDENVTFERINDVSLYATTNIHGYNGVVEYLVTTTEGLTYKITTYINIEKTDKSWVINSIL